jgi:cytochrome c553
MKRFCSIAIMLLVSASFAAAQIGASPSTDVLGAHLNYGRGCAACHAPHSGAYGNGAAKTADPTAGQSILWGQDVESLYGQTITSGGVGPSGARAASSYSETLPASMSAGTPDVTGLLTCLSCHDGNYAKGAMMKNQIYETLPPTYGTYNTVPTLIGINEAGAGTYLADHPVGLNAQIGCGGQYNWDCTISAAGAVQMTGANSSKFVKNYGFFVSPGVYNNTPVVVCTTCHNQHLMNVVNVTAKNSGQPAGYYQTMFFLVGPYNPASGTANSNQTAQFCRQCHGGEANESNNGTAGTIY